MCNSQRPLYVFLFIAAILLLQVVLPVSAQTSSINFNEKYNFPFSAGFEYSTYSPVTILGTDYDPDYDIMDLSVIFRMPIRKIPQLQPELVIGLESVTYAGRDDDNLTLLERVNHQRVYGLIGAAYVYRMSKQIEFGGDLLAGFGQSYYSNLTGEDLTYGDQSFIAELGGKFAFNVSYNLSAEFHPTLRYAHAMSSLDTFNGFSLGGLSFSISYRGGVDPDAPQAEIRSIRFQNAEIQPLFAAMQSFYVKNPIGKVTITNIEKFAVSDVTVSFLQNGFMDGPTKAVTFPELQSGESKEIDLLASFNQQVFRTEGITPMNGEIIVEYDARGRLAKQSTPVTYDLYDKEALTWDDTRKAAAFVTSSDSALRNYSSFVRQACKEAVVPGMSEALQTAMEIYYGLTEIGVLYQRDPTTPFDAAQQSMVVDAVSLPRNTLKRATGDCDDLSVLYTSVLETTGIETAFVTVPGHIFIAFNTKVPGKNYNLVHPDKEMTIDLNGELWIPVEITMIGEESFLTAWRTGIEEFRTYDDNPSVREVVIIRKAQETYRPVGLTETDLGLQYGEEVAIFRNFSGEIDDLISLVLENYEVEAREKGTKGSFNQLGIAAAQFGEYSKAEQAFNSALSLDRNYMPAKINLANVFFMKEEFQSALRLLHSVEADYEEKGRTDSESYHKVVLNLSRSYYELENYDMATEYSNKLKELNPAMAEQYSYLSGGESGTRAADIHSRTDVLFSEGD